MVKILGIAYIYPPGDAVGARRFLNYMRIFDHLKFAVDIISCDRKTYDSLHIPVNDSSRAQLKHRIIRRIPFIPVPRPLFKLYWIIKGLIYSVQIIRKEHINRIFATGDPWFVLMTGALLSRITNIEFIADYRDPWSPSLNIKRGLLSRIMETFVIKSAKSVIFTTEQIRKIYSKTFPQFKIKYRVIENGIDTECMGTVLSSTNSHRNNKLKLIFSGNIIPVREPGLVKLFDAYRCLEDDIQKELLFTFFTNTESKVYSIASGKMKENNLKINSYVPKETLYNSIAASDLCIMIDNSTIEVATKLIEYIALKKRVIAIIPENSANADLIRKYRAGWIIDSNDSTRSVEAVLNDVYAMWKEQRLCENSEISIHELGFEKNIDIVRDIFRL